MTNDATLQKADFGAIYDQPDPRAYFNTLEELDYVIPQHGADVVERLLRERTAGDGPTPTVLDVCCSYGIVATLLKTDLEIADVYAHYREPGMQTCSSERLTAVDERLLLDRRRPNTPRVVGLDVAQNAVNYAVAIGALDAGAAENLEHDDPSAHLSELLSDVDMITTTGGVGYVTDRTFGRLLEVAPESAWVAAFCLRTYDYAPIAERLGARGLHTEQATRTFAQRRIADQDEQRWAISEVEARGLDPAGKEADGYYHAELYLSRPAREAEVRPLAQILPELA